MEDQNDEELGESGPPNEPPDIKFTYNPGSEGLKDLSLAVHGGRMVVSASYIRVLANVNEDGNPILDSNGRPTYMATWESVTACQGDRIFRPKEPLPTYLIPNKPFTLEGLIDGQPRFRETALTAFAAGTPPPEDLVDRVRTLISARVAFANPRQLEVVVAYIAMTYVFFLLRRCPFLALHSDSPGAGKTTLMETMARLVFNAHMMSKATRAVSVRIADLAASTLLLDEMDVLASRREGTDHIEFLNCRSDSGATYHMMSPKLGIETYRVFGPTVLANLAGYVSTIRSRSIVVEMRPAQAGDAVLAASYIPGEFLELREAFLLWAGANWRDIIAHLESNLPAFNVGHNRHADLWRPLLVCAFCLGGESMWDDIWEAAAESARTQGNDDVTDVMALAIAQTIQERMCTPGSFHVGLKFLRSKAQAMLEEDRRQELSSKRVAGFARSIGLGVTQMSCYDHANGVTFAAPDTVLATLQARFPHLADSLGEAGGA